MWFVFIFTNGTVFFLFNATVVAAVVNITLPAAPLAPPVVELDKVAVPALYVNNTVVVPVGGGGLVTIRYVLESASLTDLQKFNITTKDLFLI